jgi:hypothetical protein
VVLARTEEEGDFVIDMALDLESILNPQVFFRINRQLIARHASCKSYSDAGFGKLLVEVHSTPGVNTVVSQLKAKAFRIWLENLFFLDFIFIISNLAYNTLLLSKLKCNL